VVGIAGILAMAAIVYLVFEQRIPFTHRYEIHGVFSSSTQLRSGSPVRIAGVDVGRVTGVSSGPGSTADVTMAIDDNGRPIHTNATMRIRPRVFLEGGFFVELDPGSPGAPDLGDGGTIPLSQTAVPVQFDQIISTLDMPVREGLRRIIKESSQALAGGGAEGLRSATKHFAPTLRDLAIVAEATRGTQPNDLSRLISSSAKVTGALASRDAQLADLVTQLNRTSSAVAAQDGALGLSVHELDRLLRVTPAALDAINRVIPAVDRFRVALQPTVRLAPPVLRQLHTLSRGLNGLGNSSVVAGLLNKLRPTLQNLPRFSLLARGLFPLAGDVATCLRDNVMPTLRTPVNDGPLSSGRPVWQDFMHATVGLASASQNFDANGPWLRYLAGFGPQLVSTGSIPGIGRLLGSTSQPILGSRPLWHGSGQPPPPFRPDAPCTKQAPPDLTATTGQPMAAHAATATQPSQPLTEQSLRRLLLHPAISAGHGGQR
jgi:virulence factor Mce-like protein